MDQITFEQLPHLVGEIRDRLSRIEKQLACLTTSEHKEESLMTISDAAKLLTLAESTIYGKVCRREIPVNKKGKRLYFERDKLLAWVRNGKKTTSEDLFKEADRYFKNSRIKK